MITLYMIRDKHTGHHIPLPQGRNGQGGSHVVPVAFAQTTDTVPRLFATKRNAENCLRGWLYSAYAAERNAQDMEIVEVSLALVVSVTQQMTRKAA